MKLTLVLGISVLSATLGCALAVAQEYMHTIRVASGQSGKSRR